MPRPDIPHPVNSVVRKINRFFRRQQWKEVPVFLFFVLLSAGFWYLQSLQQEFEIEITVPVKYKNIPEGIILAGDHPPAVVAKIRDKGIVLINYSWLNTFNPVEINIKGLLKSEQPVVTAKTIEYALSKQLIASTTLLAFEPQSIHITYTELQTKMLPVEADVNVSLESGYQVSGEITLNPPTVQAHADAALLDTLTRLKTVPVELKKASRTTQITAALQKIDGLRTEPGEVTLTIPVEEYTEKRLTIPVQCENLPENHTLRLFPASVEITCNIPVSRFKDLTENDFEIRIPFREFQAGQATGKITLRLTRQPARIATPAIQPDIIEYIIERNEP
jgi:hypothetical protein